jgi:hypothetical protein
MKIIFTLTTFLFTITTFSQKVFLKDSTASCIAKWNKGDTKTFYILHNKESYEAGKPKENNPFGYLAYLTVLDKNSAGYTMQWRMELPDQLKKLNPHLADSLPVFNGLKIIYKTDEMGGFSELVNWQEVRDAYIGMADLSVPKGENTTMDSIMDRVKSMFSTQKMVENAFIQDIQIYHGPYGYTYSTRGTRVQTQLPSPFGNDPLPAVTSTRITELRPKLDYFKLSNIQEIDQAATAKLLNDVFKKMGLTDDKRIPMEELKKVMANFSIFIKTEYRISPSKGWVSKVAYQKTGKSEQNSQSETYVIEMKDK